MQGALSILPPGLQGYALADDQRQKSQASQMGILMQLAQLKSQQEDRQMRQQLQPLQMQQMQVAIDRGKADATQLAAKNAFFSPAGQQPYMEGGRPAIAPDPQEAMQSADQGTPIVPTAPAVAPQMNFPRMMEDAAARNFIPPEAFMTHRNTEQHRADTLRQAAELKREQIQKDYDVSRERVEAQRRSDQDRIQAQKDAARDRRAFAPQRDRMVYDPVRGGMVNKDTNVFTPTTTGADGAPLGPRPAASRPMPPGAQTKFLENQTNLRRATEALTLVQGGTTGTSVGDTEATGWKGMLSGTEIGDQVLQRMDPQGVPTRAAISDLGSMIIHDRSGAAVTAAEYPRLRPFIPKTTDDKATAETKLKRFVDIYREIQTEMVDWYTESGYNVPTGGMRPPPPQTGPRSAVPAPAIPQQRRTTDGNDPLGIR